MELTNTISTKVFVIPEQNIGALQDAMARITKRANKLKVAPPTITIGKEHVQKYFAIDYSFSPPVEYEEVKITREVTLTGQMPILPGGWILAARLDRVEDENVIASVPGSPELPEQYRSAPPSCDHCQLNRRRNETFVIHSEEKGEWKQVGRNCMSDFLGSFAMDPDRACAIFTLLHEVCEMLDAATSEGYGGSSEPSAWDAVRVIALSIAAARKHGFVSSKKAWEEGGSSTKSLVIGQLTTKNLRESERIRPTEEDYAKAHVVREWAQNVQVNSDFDHNVRVVGGMEYLRSKFIGIAAYLPVGYDRAMEKEALQRLASASSEWFGSPGTRETFSLVVTAVKSLPGGQYGPTTLVSFVQEGTGNRATWFCSGEAPEWYTVGSTHRVDATVKQHSTYNSVKQTTLSRVSPYVAKAPRKTRAKVA